MTATDTQLTSGPWAGLATPIFQDAAGPDQPAWRDNAYFAFWSVTAEPCFGVVHVSTSPNAEGRRARCSVVRDGRLEEIIDPLDPGTFHSRSIDFDLSGRILVDSPDLQLELTMSPRFTVAAFEPYAVAPALVEGRPLVHHEIFCDIQGVITVRGSSAPVTARAFRDRTWGFREESLQIVEYISILASFDTFDVSVTKFGIVGGEDRMDGFYNSAAGQQKVTGLRVTRDEAGLYKRSTVTLEDGSEVTLEIDGRLGGIWCPQGAEREGPTFATYDDFIAYRARDEAGLGLVEQGILHRVW